MARIGSGHRGEMSDHSTNGASSITERARDRVRAEEQAYAATTGEDRPLGGYAALLSIYLSYVGVLVGIVAWRRKPLPERLDARDLALLTLATHKASRIVTKDPVTSPLRAAFTRFAGPIGEGEIQEEVRGKGLRHAVGELLTCPFCIGQWIATLLVFGMVVAPRFTRLAASTFAMLTGSDLLQLAYGRAREMAD
jgi:hypothetical protein